MSDLMITGVVDGSLSGGLPKAIQLFAVNDIADEAEAVVEESEAVIQDTVSDVQEKVEDIPSPFRAPKAE